MTAPTPTAATPEELAAQTAASLFDGTIITESRLRDTIAAAIRQHSEGLRAEIERLNTELAREEETCGDVIDQRDAAEKALSDLFSMVMGRPPEWSNLFGYSEALDECDGALSASQERERKMREALKPFLDAAAGMTDFSIPNGAAALRACADHHLRTGTGRPLTFGDFRRLRAALAAKETADGR